jgi:hypothetical protein
MSLKASEVFTPGAFPTRTYVERTGERLEQTLRDAIDTPGQIVSLVGPSKSGKTVLVEKVVGRDWLITVTGAGIGSPDDIWGRVLDWMGAPTTQTKGSTTSGTVGAGATATASASLLGLAKATGEVTGDVAIGHEREKSAGFERSGLAQTVREIAHSDFVVLVDDFHYMPRDVQAEAAKTLKEAVRLGVKVCTAAVQHRGDDLVRANPELRGRVRAVDLEYWRHEDLRKIAVTGFGELNARLDDASVTQLAQEAAGSPQLMQLLCLNTCFVLGIRTKASGDLDVTIDEGQREEILQQASASTDFRSLVDVLDAGPRTRGTERKLYNFSDGTQGDVYRCVLKAVASDPPRLSFSYDELTKRTAIVCREEPPVGSSVVGTCLHMSRLALERFPNERAIDWDDQKQVLDVPDPYLLFYLRWSGRLSEGES